MRKPDIDNLIALLRATEQEATQMAVDTLKKHDYTLMVDDANFVFAVPNKGSVPVCFVAHLDTRRDETKPADIRQIGASLCNINGILGADDRAGVHIILEILRDSQALYGGLPHILLTHGEESGGIGVKNFLKTPHPEDPTLKEEFYKGKLILEPYIPYIHAFIEYDRRGVSQYVTYGQSENEDLCDIVEFLGYHQSWGSYSDVADISKATNVAHLNLSAGFTHEHTKRERLLIPAIEFAVASGHALTDLIIEHGKQFILPPPKKYTSNYSYTGPAHPSLTSAYYRADLPWETPKPTEETTMFRASCDLCGKHKKDIEYYEGADALLCGKCVNRVKKHDPNGKVSSTGLDEAYAHLEQQRVLSRNSNKKHKVPCPKCYRDTFVESDGFGKHYCHVCDLPFWYASDGRLYYTNEDSTVLLSVEPGNERNSIRTELVDHNTKFSKCWLCGEVHPNNELRWKEDVDHELVLVACQPCWNMLFKNSEA